MFSSAFKSISSSSNISSNYAVAPSHTSTAGPWKIFDCKKKSTGKAYSVFVFDRKTLDAGGHGQASLGRGSASALKRAGDEVVERLRREASSLARLRHPSILELVEPVEDTRGGGLQFVTEAVTASLASLLQEKDDQERAGGVGGRASRYVTEDSDGVRRRRELEIDELEIQKGLLQVSKALEFLHDNAGLVHANLTPDAVLVNAKSDWKISGLAFCSPPEGGSTRPAAASFQPVSLAEILSPDPRLPRFVQLNLDYTSPDFVLDNNLTAAADMFSLGLLCVALYNSPHRSPLETHGSVSSYKRLFASSSTVPSPSNGFLSTRPLPRDLSAHVLPRLITRRPAQRMTAAEFQNSEYFDNILVSTIRFLDGFPAKTPNEKAQFMRGLNKVLPSFPKSVMEKKILPALLDELKDRDLIALILQNVFKIIELLPSAKRVFADKVRLSLKDIFVAPPAAGGKRDPGQQEPQRDPAKDAGLMVVLENMSLISSNCGGKEFTDDILPIIMAAIESATPAVVDAALRGLPAVLPVLDFSTIKNELFPVIATVFSKTSSLAIKVRGCQAFVVLCGGSSDPQADGLGDFGADTRRKGSSSSMLDKYTMQEKIVPLVKAIKTKEPAVMMAALGVLRVVGEAADADFVAMEILPILWSMSLGPLLNLKQFQAFMDLVKSLSRRVEDEQTRKLQELSQTGNGTAGAAAAAEDFMAFGGVSGTAFDASNGTTENDFESLVKGRASTSAVLGGPDAFSAWDEPAPAAAAGVVGGPVSRASTGSRSQTPRAATFAWSSPSPTQAQNSPATSQFGGSVGRSSAAAAQQPFRTVTPDLGGFQAMTPSTTQFSQPLQPKPPAAAPQQSPPPSSINWSSAGSAAAPNPWASASTSASGGMAALAAQRPAAAPSQGSFSLAPPPGAGAASVSSFSLPPPSSSGRTQQPQQQAGPGMGMGMMNRQASGMSMGMMGQQQQQQQQQAGSLNSLAGLSLSQGPGSSMNSMMGMGMGAQQQQQQQKQAPGSGLDKYQSLI